MFDINKDDKSPEVLARCPQCNELMANMGYDFAAPEMKAEKEWAHLKTLYNVGMAFHSCGCSGPGYIPANKQELIEHFKGILAGYQQQLSFCRGGVTPGAKPERDADGKIKVSGEYARSRKSSSENNDAIVYWIEKIKLVEEKLKLVE